MKKIIIGAVLSVVSVVAFAQQPVVKEKFEQDKKSQMHVMKKHHKHVSYNVHKSHPKAEQLWYDKHHINHK